MTDIKNIKTVTFCKAGSRTKSLIDQRFGSLFVMSHLGYAGDHRQMWLCYCECGQWTAVRGENLVTGNSTNCGNLREIAFRAATRKHGMSHKIPEYAIWKSIRGRCNNPRNQSYADYGERGIKLCDRWNQFENFLADVGKRPSKHHSLDRKDNNLGYSPDNCKWATRTEQNNNKRSNRSITYRGRTQNLQQWVDELHFTKAIFYRGLLLGKTSAESIEYALERKGKNTPAYSFPL